MPVTATAKRALRSSKQKESVNKVITANLEYAIRTAKRGQKQKDITKAMSLADRAAKKGLIHRNKAARIKSQLAKLAKPKSSKSKKSKKKTTKK
jgi:small subunit ribosomal protein S20